MDSRGPDFHPMGVTQLEPRSVRPSVLIGLGEGGERIAFQVIDWLGKTYIELKELIGFLRLDVDGLHPLDSAPASSSSPTKPLRREEGFALLQEFREEAVRLLAETLRKINLRPVTRKVEQIGYRVQPGTDIYLVGSLEEAFTRTIIPDATILLEEAYRSWKGLTLSLILVLPSEDVILGDEEEIAKLRILFKNLKEHLAGLAKAKFQTVSIDYCYLIDWFSLDSAQQGEGVAAAFLAFLISSGLSGDPSYEELKLTNLRETWAVPKARALCSGIGYSAYVLPIESLIRYCTYKLGASIIGKGLRGEPVEEEEYSSSLERVMVHTGLLKEEKPRKAEPLAVRLMADSGLDPHRILSDLKRDEEGQPLVVTLDPKEMYAVPQEELADRILSLDAFFGRNEMPKYQKQMESRMAEIKERAQTLLADTVDLCITTLPRGLQTARDLVKRLSERVARGMEEEEKVPHIPDLNAYRRQLETAILNCPRRGAVMARFFLLALFEAYVIPFLYALLYPEPNLLTRLILVIGVVLLNAVLAAGIIFLAESRVARAHRDFIEAVTEKYETIIDHWARHHRKSIQQAILDCLEREEEALSAWEKVLNDAQEALLEGTTERYIPTANETSLVKEGDYETWYDERVTWEATDLTEEYLRAADLSKWREATFSSLQNSVYEFCLSKCRGAFEDISLERYLVENRWDLREVMKDMEAWAKPLLHYGRHLTRAEIPLKILAVTDAGDTIMNRETTGRADIHLVSTHDRERLSYFHTVHAIALEDLDIVRLLRKVGRQMTNAPHHLPRG